MKNKAPLAAVVVYLFFAALLGFQTPGLHNDEAVYYSGAVHLLNSPGEPSFAHDPWSWITIFGRRWPVMIFPYAGALRNYLALPVFALLGPTCYAARLLTALVGAFAIWAFSVLVRDQIDPLTASLTAFILAINPSYLATNLYNQGVAEWIAPFAVICLALARYLKARSTAAAFWLGAAMGFGVWTRANIVWLLASMLLAAAAVLGRRLAIPLRQLAALALGGIIGGAPLLWYEIRSRGATFAFMRSMANTEPLPTLLAHRFDMLSQILLLSGANREMWSGPPLPLWQLFLFCAVVVISTGLCLTDSAAPVRAAALTFLLLLVCMLFWRLNIADQHLIALVPLAALLVAIATRESRRRWPRVRYLPIAIGIVYAGSALYWNLAMARQLRSTGGTGLWSNAIDSVRSELLDRYPGRAVKTLDWGFEHSLFVLSNAKIKTTDLFWNTPVERSGSGQTWPREIVAGDVYLLHAPELVQFPAAQEGFLKALGASRLPVRRLQIRQNSGAGYAEVLEIPY